MGTSIAQKVGMEALPVESHELRALDPDLPIIAARAAMQLDLFISTLRRGDKVQRLRTDAIQQLATMISSVNAESGNGSVRGLVDPVTANLLSRAYSEAAHAQLKSLQDLEGAMKDLAKMLAEVSRPDIQQSDPLKGLTLVRDFCVKLSEYAASKRQLAFGERPAPAYRR